MIRNPASEHAPMSGFDEYPVHQIPYPLRVVGTTAEDRAEISCGPITFEPIEPFRQWRLTLADNEYGLAFELYWKDTARPVLHGFPSVSVSLPGVNIGGRLVPSAASGLSHLADRGRICA
jgi:hypothetical protein